MIAAPTLAADSHVFQSALDVCAFVDELPADAAGELVFVGRGAVADGLLFVETGRICWVAARGLAQRLSGLLAASAKLDLPSMESLYGKCKRQKSPLGEYLVSAGFVTAAELRSALLRHTAESLHALCKPGTRADWIARCKGGYSARFTFTTTELAARTFAEAHRTAAEESRVELAEAFNDGGWGAAFVRTASRATPDPIAVHGAAPEKLDALVRLGQWAVSSLDVTDLLQDDQAFVTTVLDDSALVAWRTGATIVAGWTGVHGPARLLNRRARARRKDVSHGL